MGRRSAIPERSRCQTVASATPWRYWRPSQHRENLVEWSSVRGTLVGLPTHFHDEDQVTLVISGRRRFAIRDEIIELGPGEMIVFSAGTVHASLHEIDGAHCLNAYLKPGTASDPRSLGDLLLPIGAKGVRTIASHSSRVGSSARVSSQELGAPQTSVGTAAASVGMSREGFSRAFRRGAGIAPHAFQMTRKLNRARELLRQGMPIASAAATAGFADQSHLGRCFRATFGVTPGAYRSGL